MSLDRFSYTGGGFAAGKLEKSETGDLIRLADVQDLIAAAFHLELYGATVCRLEQLGKELRKVGL